MTTETLPTPRWASEAFECLAFRESVRALDPRRQSLQRDDSGPIDDDDIRASIEAVVRALSPSRTITRLYRQYQTILDDHVTCVPEGRLFSVVAKQEADCKWQKIYDKLVTFGSLEQGWDGYNALPPNELACENAREFVEVLSLAKLLPSRCKPTVIGGVGITLRKGHKKVYVEFYNNRSAHFLKSDGSSDPIAQRIGTGYSQYLRFISRIVDYLNA